MHMRASACPRLACRDHSRRRPRLFRGLLVAVAAPLLSLFPAGAAEDAEATHRYDVVIYGGTSAGVTAAIQTARMGKSVLIVNHYPIVGGLTASGLGATDAGREAVIGGISREFYQRVRDYYRDDQAWRQETREEYMERSGRFLQPDDDAQWGFEPHVAQKIYADMLEEEDVPVVTGEFLVRDNGAGVVRNNGRIEAIIMESGNRYEGKMFLDATYEGDLMAEAGVSYIVGREGNETYGETLNGIQTANTESHMFTYGHERYPERPLPEEYRVSPYVVEGDPESGLLDGINPDPGGEDGDPDHRVQAYCYRLCMTTAEDNMVPIEAPEGYNPDDFELLFRMFEAGEDRTPWHPADMPNLKSDTNNNRAVSTNLIGGSDDYPEASYEERREIEAEHKHWQQGLLYTLATHPRIPDHVQEEVNQWGYAADEFEDNDHWPYHIYVRVGRRMVSDYVITEHNCRLDEIPFDPVGMGSYNMDSHNVQRFVTEQGYAQNEGNIEEPPAGPYRISYRSIVPKQEEAENLFVPVAVSSSHIAFGSIRMEPVFMVLGQSAATAAVLAIDEDTAVQEVDYGMLRERLLQDGQVLDMGEAVDIDPTALPGIVVDNRQAAQEGRWGASASESGFVGLNYLHDGNSDKGGLSIRYEPRLSGSGRHEIRLSYTPHANRASNVPVTVIHAGGSERIEIDQRREPSIDGVFVSLGEFELDADSAVVISNEGTDGFVIADAVQFLPVDNS